MLLLQNPYAYTSYLAQGFPVRRLEYDLAATSAWRWRLARLATSFKGCGPSHVVVRQLLSTLMNDYSSTIGSGTTVGLSLLPQTAFESESSPACASCRRAIPKEDRFRTLSSCHDVCRWPRPCWQRRFSTRVRPSKFWAPAAVL